MILFSSFSPLHYYYLQQSKLFFPLSTLQKKEKEKKKKKEKVIYMVGSPLQTKDQERSQMAHAQGIFILPGKLLKDNIVSLYSIAIKSTFPEVPLIVQSMEDFFKVFFFFFFF